MTTSTRISTTRWRARIGIALVVLALVIAVAALGVQAWAIVSGGSHAIAPGGDRRVSIVLSMKPEGGEP